MIHILNIYLKNRNNKPNTFNNNIKNEYVI
jgi:hypothetical protein